jgi:hypothetical protein
MNRPAPLPYLLIALCLGSVLLFARQTAKTDALAGVMISYSFPSRNLTIHQPVILSFQVINDTSQPLNLDLGVDRTEGFSFSLTRPDGVKLKLPTLSPNGLTRAGRIVVQPAASYSQNLLLDRWYAFSTPGKYELEGYLVNPIVLDATLEHKQDPGFRETLDFTPRDELALSKAYDALASEIEAADNWGDAAEDAFALSYMRDPIAVAYLRRALFAHKLLEPTVINGLEKIGNDEAIQTLIEALRNSVPAYTDLIRRALNRVQNQTNDPQLRQKIETALSQP